MGWLFTQYFWRLGTLVDHRYSVSPSLVTRLATLWTGLTTAGENMALFPRTATVEQGPLSFSSCSYISRAIEHLFAWAAPFSTHKHKTNQASLRNKQLFRATRLTNRKVYSLNELAKVNVSSSIVYLKKATITQARPLEKPCYCSRFDCKYCCMDRKYHTNTKYE